MLIIGSPDRCNRSAVLRQPKPPTRGHVVDPEVEARSTKDIDGHARPIGGDPWTAVPGRRQRQRILASLTIHPH